MPSWNELLTELESQGGDQAATQWMNTRMTGALSEVSRLRGDRNVLLYGSAFLQKPQAPQWLLSLTAEEINGLMSVLYGMDFDRGLTLILHTPGGVINAAESFVAYLRSKFTDIEVIVPTFAMSAGTMISLSANRVVMGRPSQLGPIDPQMPFAGRTISARAVVEQFEQGKTEIRADLNNAHAWAPVLQSVGPSLLVEAQNALAYGEEMVARWLSAYMFGGQTDAEAKGKAVAEHFNDASKHKSHGRRIDRAEAAAEGVVIEELEASQALQEQVLTAYHLMTITFEKSPAIKMMNTATGQQWVKSWLPPEVQAMLAGGAAPPAPSPARPFNPGPAPGARPVGNNKRRGR